ncbi:MAG: hypothetical protein AAFY54_19805 [Cyanobacteria bacterium J06648_10]
MDTVSLTIDWREANSQLSEPQQEALTQTMYRELRGLEAVETVERVADSNMPDGAMGAQWLWSILTAEIPGEALGQACTEVFRDELDEVIDKLVSAAQQMKEAG